MSDHRLEHDLRAAWDEIYRPAPWLLSRSMTAVRRAGPARSNRGWLAGLAAALLCLSMIAVFQVVRQELASHQTPIHQVNTSSLPQPTPQEITQTSTGAQVAWISMQAEGQTPSIVGIDPSGRIVARLDEPNGINPYGIWRSADGSEIFTLDLHGLSAYSAATGSPLKAYPLPGGGVIGDGFSPDGHWMAVLVLNTDLMLDVIDLQTGNAQLLTFERNSKANAGVVVFSADSSRVYALTGWDTSMRLTAFSVNGAKLSETGSGVAGEPGRNYPACPGPAVPAWIMAGGTTLVAFCHANGAVLFFDLKTLDSSGVVQSHQPNPFWLSPIFTPDGQLLYLHQWPAFGDTMQVVDLADRRLVGPLPTPTRVGQGGLFAGLFTDVYAGGVASTEPISPDGLTLYSATPNGVIALRVPDLKPIATLGQGFDANEVWVSGNGQTIYAISEDGKTLLVMRADGSAQKAVSLPSLGVGFVASEHG